MVKNLDQPFKIYWTERFLKKMVKFNLTEVGLPRRMAELQKRYNQDPTNWHRGLERLTAVQGSMQVYRDVLTTGDRIVFVLKNNYSIVLVDIGNHDVMREYGNLNKKIRNQDLATAKVASETFMNYVALRTNTEKKDSFGAEILEILLEGEFVKQERLLYVEELGSPWVTYLDLPQKYLLSNLLNKISSPSENMTIDFVIGGAGTGKTVILHALALELRNRRIPTSFDLKDQVAKYLKSGDEPIPGYQIEPIPSSILLVDDPLSLEELKLKIRKARSAKCRAVVVAFDPLQWHDRDMEKKIDLVCERNPHQTHVLRVCYRQSGLVGEKASKITRSIFSRTSKWSAKSEVKKLKNETSAFLTLSLDMEFVDSDGFLTIYSDDTNNPVDYERELNRFRSRKDLWEHWHPIAFVIEDEISSKIKTKIKKTAIGLNRTEIKLSNYQTIRGVEYQEVFLFISQRYWDEVLTGIEGASPQQWKKLTCLHTILSRPKDGLTIFVVGESGI
jgi:hypothetical protein